MKSIGIRTMGVIMWCATMITIIMVCCIVYKRPLGVSEISGLGLIAGLGGFHSYKQAQADAIINMPEKRPAVPLDDKQT
jgi:hypothetical protein